MCSLEDVKANLPPTISCDISDEDMLRLWKMNVYPEIKNYISSIAKADLIGEVDFTVIGEENEYTLPSDFKSIIQITTGDCVPIQSGGSGCGGSNCKDSYYIKFNTLFVNIVSGASTVKLQYEKRSTVSSVSDSLPFGDAVCEQLMPMIVSAFAGFYALESSDTDLAMMYMDQFKSLKDEIQEPEVISIGCGCHGVWYNSCNSCF